MFIEKEKLMLHNYGDHVLLEAGIEETEDQIAAVIKYNDHGDEFICVVSNKDEQIYEYGWWLNRNWAPEYDDLDRYPGMFQRNPKLNGKYENPSDITNSIYWLRKDYIRKHGSFSPEIYKDKETAQWYFDCYVKCVKRIYDENHDQIYHYVYGYDEDMEYLVKNDILTPENEEKLLLLKKYYRIDEIDGVAGKQKTGSFLYGDDVEWIWKDGRFLEESEYKIDRTEETDEWGCDQFELDLTQFVK